MSLRVPAFAALVAFSFFALALYASAPSPETPEEVLESTSFLPLDVETDSATNPTYVSITLPGTEAGAAPLLRLDVTRTGLDPAVRVTLDSALATSYDVAGSLLLLGDPQSSAFKIQVLDGANEGFAARITRTGATPAVDAWRNATGSPPQYHHLESPLRYQMEGATLTALAVVAPDGSEEHMRIEKTATGYLLIAGDTSQPITADVVAITPQADTFTFRFRDVGGNEVQTVTVDRTSDPAVITLAGTIEETRAGPIAYQGQAQSPTRLIVNDADGKPLVAYRAGGGTASLVVADQTLLSDATFVRIEGDLLSDDFVITLRDAQGQWTTAIDRAALLGLAPADVPIATVTAPLAAFSQAPQSRLLRISEGNAVLAPEDLAGRGFLRATGTHTAFLETKEAPEAFERILLTYAKKGDTQDKPATFQAFQYTVDTKAWRADYAPAALGTLRDGDTIDVHFYLEKRLAPTAVQRFEAPYTASYRLDTTAPTVTLSAPASADDFKFPVSWSGVDALSGIKAYEVQWRQAGATSWQPWTPAATATQATFSGAWGTTYQFRARAIDHAGNPSDWKETATAVAAQPAGSDDVNDAPSIRLVAPQAGDTVGDLFTLKWEASDPDGTPVIVTVELSGDDGKTWRTLYSGIDKTLLWNTLLEPDGKVRLRLTATDGTLSDVDAASVTIANSALAFGKIDAPGSGGDDGTQGAPTTTPPASSAPAQPAKKRSLIPAPGALLALGVVGAAAMLVARRK